MKATLALLSGVFFAAQAAAPDISSLGPLAEYPVAWGKPVNGLRVGIWSKKTEVDVGPIPEETYFHIENVGTTNIAYIIQSATHCVLSVNGKLYAAEDYGGKTSAMPPGRHYGPISIRPERKHEIGKLRDQQISKLLDRWAFDKGSPPSLAKGTNTLSVFYQVGSNFVQSAEIHIVAK